MAQAELAEAVEVLVVEEELRDEEVRPGLLLDVERLHRALEALGLDVALGVARGADAEVTPGLAEVGDEVGGMLEVHRAHAGTTIPTQGEHVLDALSDEFVDVGVHVGLRGPDAGEVCEGRGAEVVLDGGRDPGRVEVVARSAGGVGDRDPVRRGRGHLARYLVGILKGHLALGRKDLERIGLPRGKLVDDSHGCPSPLRFVEPILTSGETI